MWQKNVRYLDYNATSGVSKAVSLKLTELLGNPEILANPSSRHRLGQRSRALLYDASIRVSKSFGRTDPDEVVFTSSGTEANQTVLRSISKHSDLLILGAGEHSSSRDWGDSLSPINVEELPLLSNGQYDGATLTRLLAQAKADSLKSVGLSLTLANNETGVLLNTQSIQDIIQKSGISVLLHLDGAQVWGKTSLDLGSTGADYVTFSSHKIGAPSGTGVIWLKKTSPFEPLFPGSQARGFRGGSENLIGIIATGAAAATLNPEAFAAHTRPLIERLEAGLESIGHPIRIWGKESARVPNTSRFSILNFNSYENWVELLDLRGYAVSHGSACKAQVIEPSHVLLKMGASKRDALNSLRISVGPDNTLEDIDGFLSALKQTLIQKVEVRA